MAIDITNTTKDAYTWRITYHDGRQVSEFDDERPDGRGFAEIDSLQVKRLRLLLPSGIPAHVVSIPDSATPVFFRRRTISINPNNDTASNRPVKHCIGWEKDEQAAYLFVFDDGSTLLTTDKQAV